MNKRVRKKYDNIIQEADPKKYRELFVKVTNEALDDIYLNDNADEGLKTLRTTLGIMRDEFKLKPYVFLFAWNEIQNHLLDLEHNRLERSIRESDLERSMRLNLVQMGDLVFIVGLERCLRKYELKREEAYLDGALNILNEFKKVKMVMLDPESIPDALEEFDSTFDEYGHETVDKLIRKLIREIKSLED